MNHLTSIDVVVFLVFHKVLMMSKT